MSDVLVTGGAGFIGSNLVDRLIGQGLSVAALDDLSSGKKKNLAEAETTGQLRLHVGSLLDEGLAGIFAEERPKVALHLAAQIDVRRSVADPLHDAMTNVIGTVRVLELAARHGVEKVVYTTSGGCIYGQPPREDLPVAEDYPGHAHSPYGAGKRCGEEYLHTYAALYGLRWTSLALANVFGPRQDPAGEAGVVSIFTERMLRDEPVTIFGTGEQTRDFVYVDDVVDAFVAAMDAADGMRVNIGTGEEVSVNQLFSELRAITGYGRAASYGEARPGELDHISVDPARAGREMGWAPRRSLREGLEATVAHIAADMDAGT